MTIWYGACYLFTLVGVLCTHIPKLQRAVQKRFKLGGQIVCNGHFLIAFLMAGLLILLVVYWAGEHDWHNHRWKSKTAEASARATHPLAPRGRTWPITPVPSRQCRRSACHRPPAPAGRACHVRQGSGARGLRRLGLSKRG